jgi:hypothetical protein
MDTYAIRIDPDGLVVRYDDPDLARYLATGQFDGQTDVVVLAAPFLPPGLYVGFIHDWGKVIGLPLNRPAWALYGRSPIFGPMFVKRDDDGPLDPALCDMLEQGAIPSLDTERAMDAWLADDRARP